MKKILGIVVGREVDDDQNGFRLLENSLKIPNDFSEDSKLPEWEGQRDGSKTESLSLFHKIPHLFMMTPKV